MMMDTQTIIIWLIYLIYILVFLCFYKKLNHFENLKILRLISNKYFNIFLFGFIVLLFLALLYFNSAMSDIPTHKRGALGARIIIGTGAHVGLNSTVREDIKVGHYSIIGMSSVVVANVDEFSIVAGNPARFIKKIQV